MPDNAKSYNLLLFNIAIICWMCLQIDAFGAAKKKSQQRQQAARQFVVGSNSRRAATTATAVRTTATDLDDELRGQKWGTTMDDDNEQQRHRHNWGQLEEQDDDDPNSRLTLRIRTKARPYRRPVKHSHDPIEVHVRSSLYQIVDLDQRNNLATLSAYFDVHWMDAFLQWNSSDFDGITTTFVPLRWVWRPEFYLYHSIQSRTPDFDPAAMVEVQSDGTVRLFVPITSRALCPINVKYFPYDTQNCTFLIGSWSYQSEFVRLIVDERDVFLGDFYDNQEWLLVDAMLSNGSMLYLRNESFSTVQIQLILRRQSFYYVFNLVFPTTLVSLVAVIGFHAPINATGRRESKFRLGVMTLLSLSVMLLMLVDEMKFALESIPGQRGSFSDVPLIGIYYMSLISVISVSTCTSSIFVHIEKYAIRNPGFQSVPQWLRFLCAKKLFCCYVPMRVRLNKGEEFRRNKNIRCNHFSSSLDSTNFRTLIPNELNFADFNHHNARQIALGNTTLEEPPPPIMLNSTSTAPLLQSTGICSNSTSGALEAQRLDSKLDLLIALLRELLETRRELRSRGQLPIYWERVIQRLENCSLCFYLGILALNIFFFMWPELWY